MAIDFLSMLNEQKEAKKEVQKASKEQKKKTVTNAPKYEEALKKAKDVPKKETSGTKKTKESKEVKGETFEYPFSLYTEGRTVDISEYGFEDKKKYTPKEICDIMLRHKHFEFAGEMTFKLFEDDNILVATAKQYKKG